MSSDFVPCKKRPPACVEARIYLKSRKVADSFRKGSDFGRADDRLTLSGHFNTESQGDPNGRVRGAVVVGVTVVVDICDVGRIAAVSRS